MRTGFILNPIFGRWSVWLRLTGVLILVMLAWMPAAAAKSADGPGIFTGRAAGWFTRPNRPWPPNATPRPNEIYPLTSKKQGGKVHIPG